MDTREEIMIAIPRHTWRGITGKAHALNFPIRPITARANKTLATDPLLIKLFTIVRSRNLSINDIGEDALGGGATARQWYNGSHSPKLRLLRKVLDYLSLDVVLVDLTNPPERKP